MPYIKKEDREVYDHEITCLLSMLQGRPIGDVNYVISRIIWSLFNSNKSYTTGNNLVGVLECVKQEFIRRKLNEYEENKIKENGDLPE